MSQTGNCDPEATTPGGRCESCEREPVGRIICQTSEALQDLFAQTSDDVPEAASPLLPDPPSIIKALECLRQCMFPGRWLPQAANGAMLSMFIQERLSMAYPLLLEATKRALPYRWKSQFAVTSGKMPPQVDIEDEAKRVLIEFISRLPEIRAMLLEDVVAAYNGDPAAHSYAEVMVSYPCMTAIVTHRLAHELYCLGVPIVPRIMSEAAHAETGIDIHPGAQIGHSFFIDHGTGVVIGETTSIGDNVKLYQGVTLGAKSFPVDENGFPIKDIKRHPTIEDDVVIYAGATILGGDTVIGKGAVIGSNVFLAESVAPGATVTQKHPELRIRQPEATS